MNTSRMGRGSKQVLPRPLLPLPEILRQRPSRAYGLTRGSERLSDQPKGSQPVYHSINQSQASFLVLQPPGQVTSLHSTSVSL